MNKVEQSVIDSLKKDHQGLCIAELPVDDNNTDQLQIVIKKPTRQTMSMFEKYIDKDPGKAKDILVQNCVMTDKDKVMSDDGLYFAAVDAICELFPKRKAVVRAI